MQALLTMTRSNCLGLVLSLLILPAAGRAASAPSEAPDLAGTWTWMWKDQDGTPHQHVLVVEGQPGHYAATERVNELEPVKVVDLKCVGDRVSFSVIRGDVRATYTGRFGNPDTINGQVRVTNEGGQANEFGWTAQRRAVEPDPTTPPDR